MKSVYAVCFFMMMAQQSLAQNFVMEVNYQEVSPYVTTGQTGGYSITLHNNTNAPVSLLLNKSFNFYANGSTSADVRFDPDPFNPSDPCQWFVLAYSPWPPWTDGISESIRITGLPAQSSVTCTGQYHVGMTQGRHNVIWSLSQLTPQGNVPLGQHTQIFVYGPLPTATPVPLTSLPSLVLMTLVLLVVAFRSQQKFKKSIQ